MSPCANDVFRRDRYVEKAITAMRGDPARRWTVAALARIAGLSRAPFARRFRAATGIAPLRWLTELRLGLGKERLLDEAHDEPLSTIAAELGYSSEFAFSKAFKRLYGIAPGRYRRYVPARISGMIVRAAA